MKKEKRVLKEKTLFWGHSLESIDEMIQDLTELKESGATHIDCEEMDFQIVEIRMETDDEYSARVAKEARDRTVQQSKDYTEYLRLKAVFENGNTN